MKIEDVPQFLGKIPAQVRYAASRTLQIVTSETQQFITQQHLPEKLTLRNRWFKPGTRFGVNRQMSWKGKPEDIDKMSASVSSKAPWLVAQERGEVKQPKNKFLTIPVVGSPARPSESSKVVSRMKPRNEPKGMMFIEKLGGWFRKIGGKRNPRLQMLFAAASKARVKPRTHFEEEGTKKAEQSWASNWKWELYKALATMRK